MEMQTDQRAPYSRKPVLIFDSRLNKEMWTGTFYVTTYLVNKSPTENRDVTPIEK